MLEQQIKEQLKSHFASLDSVITLEVKASAHSKQDELVTMLQDVASCSEKIEFRLDESVKTDAVQFQILKNTKETGITFRCIPGGHEFTSLILAILNADGKGKLPDEGILNRVRSLQGPVKLRTYMSLSCTNCPDVIQALNIMALNNDDFSHTIIDGGLAEEEVQGLGIQGVPTVVDDAGQIIHVGKSHFAELLDTLEDTFGRDESNAVEQEAREYDVVVIGGGPAGSSAAIYSARKGLKTVIVAEKIGGQVRDTKGIENLISIPYTEGPQLVADLEKHLKEYPIDILENRKVERVDRGETKVIHLKGGEVLKTRALIVATGAKWRELGVPGEKENIGRGVAFCPHCDGPFYKGKRVAVVGGGNSGIEAALDLAGICSHVTVLEFAEELKADRVLISNAQEAENVTIITNARTTEVVGSEAGVSAIRYQDRSSEEDKELQLDGVFVQIGLAPNCAVVKDIVETNRFGEIKVDERCRTSEAGIYAAGDVTTVPFKQIIIAMGEGAKAALTAFEERIRR